MKNRPTHPHISSFEEKSFLLRFEIISPRKKGATRAIVAISSSFQKLVWEWKVLACMSASRCGDDFLPQFFWCQFNEGSPCCIDMLWNSMTISHGFRKDAQRDRFENKICGSGEGMPKKQKSFLTFSS